MGIGMHFENSLNRNVDGQISLKCLEKFGWKINRGIEMRKKLSGVHPGIGSSLPHALNRVLQQFGKGFIQNLLNG
jgi:hypothetical protein